jgi:hypothetical protein
VWIEDGSTASHLVFAMASKRGGHGNFAEAEVHRIVYGEPPPGLVSDQGPKPLLPGCYHVRVDGTGSTEFYVSANGAVTERPRSTTARP